MLDEKYTVFKSDCRHFVGYVPCKPHKEHGVHCFDCEYYEPKSKNILIVKLGAIGDVIRTTPLLHKIWELHPDARVWWLTYSPDVVPSSVDRILDFTPENLLLLQAADFEMIINLDKDPQACALTNILKGSQKFGFVLEDGMPAPADQMSRHKFLTGLFDDVNKANKKSYPEEIFEICGWEFNGEEYILENTVEKEWEIGNEGKKIIGLNTGCGARWVSRLWADGNWIELIKKIQDAGYFPLLLGGNQEHEKNLFFKEKTGAAYLGHFSLKEFISLTSQCDVVVSAVTMAMHLAVGLKKPLVLMNNIFNPYEFELYGRGEIVMPAKECHCFFSPKCKNDEYFCMDHLSPQMIFGAIERSL